MKGINPINYFAGKPQAIRALDVVFIGPVILYAAHKKIPPGALKTTLKVIGYGTILLNAKNFLIQAQINKNRGLGIFAEPPEFIAPNPVLLQDTQVPDKMEGRK